MSHACKHALVVRRTRIFDALLTMSATPRLSATRRLSAGWRMRAWLLGCECAGQSAAVHFRCASMHPTRYSAWLRLAAFAAAGLEVALVAVADVAERLVGLELNRGEAEVHVRADRALGRVVDRAFRVRAEHLVVQRGFDMVFEIV